MREAGGVWARACTWFIIRTRGDALALDSSENEAARVVERRTSNIEPGSQMEAVALREQGVRYKLDRQFHSLEDSSHCAILLWGPIRPNFYFMDISTNHRC